VVGQLSPVQPTLNTVLMSGWIKVKPFCHRNLVATSESAAIPAEFLASSIRTVEVTAAIIDNDVILATSVVLPDGIEY